MAVNVQVNVYQINQGVLDRNASQRIGFPTSGLMIFDCTSSPTRSLSSGYNVYGVIQTLSGDKYYVQETISQLATLIG